MRPCRWALGVNGREAVLGRYGSDQAIPILVQTLSGLIWGPTAAGVGPSEPAAELRI